MIWAEEEERTRRRASASSARVCDRNLSLCKATLPNPDRGVITELPPYVPIRSDNKGERGYAPTCGEDPMPENEDDLMRGLMTPSPPLR